MSIKGAVKSRVDSWCLKPGYIHFIVKLVEYVFAISGRRDRSKVLFKCRASGSLINQVALFVEWNVG